FGDSNATRTTDAFLETECVENVATTEIIKATEESNGHRVSCRYRFSIPRTTIHC
ncbi:TPA: hypothetical protein H7H16_005139, partial [Escherichia coli]|nr:hypothetical protein [Escherichia coli]HBH8439515.1 hypothetical protein [Escherichia coli]HBK0826394.1 hypothetical protein [Escherichia coli]HBK0938685.1 hypothetical protein [Escherichia coli]HBK1376324.1 hypothetical protein [Escherichia coli]